jgi:predicted nuclease of restriction endonuclease-like (RecB) superfamily
MKSGAPPRGIPRYGPTVLILSRCKSREEREFYLRLAHREGWDKRETDRQLRGALFERAVLGRPKVSPAVTQLRPDAEAIFKDSYLVDFLGLPETHSEQDLQTAIIVNLKRFLLELGRDFTFLQPATQLGQTEPFRLSSRPRRP